MKIFQYLTGRIKEKNPPEDKALQAEGAALDTFNRASSDAKKRQTDIDALKVRVKKNGKPDILSNGEDVGGEVSRV